MKTFVLGLVVVVVGGCKSESKDLPNEAPTLSAAGDVKVPPGHETTYTFDGTAVKLAYTWVEVMNVEQSASLRFHAHGMKNNLGAFSMAAAIPDHTPSLAALVNYPMGAYPSMVTFGNAPEMATGTGATITITEVTSTYVAGTFEAQACKHGETKCDSPKQIKNGKFKAFRSALSDDAAFARYTQKK